MAFTGSSPPYKKRRLMPQSVTDYSTTPSPPLTPRYYNKSNTNTFSTPLITHRMPHVDSTPIRNYFARFMISDKQNTNKSKPINDRQTIQKSITPRTLWSNSEKIIPFPPSPLEHKRKLINIDINTSDKLYNSISNETNTNESKQYYDEQPFLHPLLHQKMRDDLFKLICNINDYQRQQQQEIKDDKDEYNDYVMIDHNDFNSDNSDNSNNSNKNAMNILQTYGNNAITNVLQNVIAENTQSFELADTDIERADQFIDYLSSYKYSFEHIKRNENYSSFNDMNDGIVFLSGVLEFITATILDSAGFLAEFNHSITDTTNDAINSNCFMIEPLHIRHAISDDDQLFWLQQSISTVEDYNCQSVEDIHDELNNDCVYHICSFFCGDLPMLSSLARVNTTFYAMTSSNNLWKPIAERCFLFNTPIIRQIEDGWNDNDSDSDTDIFYDFRAYISLEEYIKLKILRERWIKQNRNGSKTNENFEIFVRINPVYIDLHSKMYNLLYVCNQDMDMIINDEIYDLFRQLLEIFGTRNDFVTISQIINNVKCLNYNQIKKRLSNVFTVKLSKYEQNDLNKVIEVEYNENNNNDKDILFLELSLSHNCFVENRNEIDEDNDKHYLWIGKNIVVFAAIPLTYNHKLDL